MRWRWGPLCTRPTRLVCTFTVPSHRSKQESVDRHVTPPGHIILIPSQSVFALYTVKSLSFVGYQFSWFSWVGSSTKLRIQWTKTTVKMNNLISTFHFRLYNSPAHLSNVFLEDWLSNETYYIENISDFTVSIYDIHLLGVSDYHL
jgi:hypothetical protein